MLRIALAQINSLVGDISGNADNIIAVTERARDTLQADLVVFPELALTGYPPEDLLLHNGFRANVEKHLRRVCQASRDIGVVVGYPYYASADTLYNAASLFYNDATLTTYFKQQLPNYGVFDEKRYFTPGEHAVVVEFLGLPISLTICEDVWFPEPTRKAVKLGAKLILNANASPYKVDKQPEREQIVQQRVKECGVPMIYVNSVGGQDELVFDGGSVVVNSKGKIVFRAEALRESLSVSKSMRAAVSHSRPWWRRI